MLAQAHKIKVTCEEKVREKKKWKKRVEKNGKDVAEQESLTEELETQGGKIDDRSQEKVMKKKKNKRVEKKGADITEKEKLASDLTEEAAERSTSSWIDRSCGGKVSAKQEPEKKKKKRKRSDVDGEGNPEPKRPKTTMSKKQTQENGRSVRPLSDDLTESKSDDSAAEFGSGVEKRAGKEGAAKPDGSKPKNPKFGAVSKTSAGCDLVEQSPQSGSPDFGNSLPPYSATGVNKKSGGKASPSKKPKFGVTPPYTSGSNSQSSTSSSPHVVPDKSGKRAVGSKPKKPSFKVSSPKSPGEDLSELAVELGEMMKKTDRESASVKDLVIPVVKVKKFAPVFGKGAQKV